MRRMHVMGAESQGVLQISVNTGRAWKYVAAGASAGSCACSSAGRAGSGAASASRNAAPAARTAASALSASCAPWRQTRLHAALLQVVTTDVY